MEVVLPKPSRQVVQRVADAVLQYLALHPAAADDEKGIAEWWLPQTGIAATVEEVRQALVRLAAAGAVQRQSLPDGRAIYGRGVRGGAGVAAEVMGVPMANFQAVHSVGNSIVTFLSNTYPTQMNGVATPACDFALVSSGELSGTIEETTRVTLYLYRVTVNEHTRQRRPGAMSTAVPAPMGLDLHFLLTAWASTAQAEQVPFTWAMRQLYLHPILDASSLSPEAGWGPDEVIQVIPAELPTEDMMRIWDALDPPYRLSVSYIARMVRIDPDSLAAATPVVATRLGYGGAEPLGAP